MENTVLFLFQKGYKHLTEFVDIKLSVRRETMQI